jgi:hypothetical protein
VRFLPPFRLYLVISVVFFLALGSPEADDRGRQRPRDDGYRRTKAFAGGTGKTLPP